MVKQKRIRVKVSRAALVARIRRKLLKSGMTLRASRGQRGKAELGSYHLIQLNRNFVARTHIDLEDCAKELGVLEGWEELG